MYCGVEGMGVEDMQRTTTEITGNELSEHKIWYNLKYDLQMLMAVEGNVDVRMVFKGNDEHRYSHTTNLSTR